MSLPRVARAVLALAPAAAAACAGIASSPTATPAPATSNASPRSPAPPLPAVPAVDGPLAITVVYPRPNQQITSRDSNFIFGSIGSGRASLSVSGVPARVYPNGAFIAFLANPPASTPQYELVAVRGADTARATQRIRLARPLGSTADQSPPRPREDLATSRADTLTLLSERVDRLRSRSAQGDPIGFVELGTPSAAADTDRTIVGRPLPGGTYKWFFLPGTVVPLMERAGATLRVRLDRALDVYVDSSDVHELPLTDVGIRSIGSVKVRASSFGADVILSLATRAPYFVEEGDRAITLTLYGVRGNTDLVNYATNDSLVRSVEWAQENAERARITVNLRASPYGYLVVWENNSLVLKLRGRPAIDAMRPLAGLTIAVDPGHPPIGSTGPTGLWEPQVTLPIGVRLERILEERGARVIMTRTTEAAVALGDRPAIARRANVNAFVSIHLNAYPDGVNPFVAPGTGSYFFRTHSEPLAREVQRGMVAQLGLADLGVNYDNLAVVRATWYPAVLCEGAFIMLPDQEAALRTPEFQQRYAVGIANGLEQYFRALPSR